MATEVPRIKNVSLRPETYARLKRIAKRRKWSLMDTASEAVTALDALEREQAATSRAN